MRFKTVPVKDLVIDKRYQRELDQARVNKIADEFDPRMLGTLEISGRNGKAAVFDGQHRLAALKKLKIDKAPCLSHEGLSPQDEAELFVQLQQARRNINPLERFRARIFAEDPVALGLKQLVEDHDYTIATYFGRKQDTRGDFKAIGTLERLYRKDPEVLGETLDLLDLWKGEPSSTDAMLLEGVFTLIYGYADRLDADALESLKAVPAQTILRRAVGGVIGGGGGPTARKYVAAELRKTAGVRGRPMTRKAVVAA